MRTTALRIVAAVSILLLFTAASVTYMRIRSARDLSFQLYSKGLEPSKDKDNFFCPHAQLAFVDSLLNKFPQDDPRVLTTEFFKGKALLNLGKEQDAIDIFRMVSSNVNRINQSRLYQDAVRSLAIAYLRLGERNNCITGHTRSSCIFPIDASAVYTDLAATQQGIELYEQILDEDSTDLASRWLLNIAYMTAGTYPRGVPQRYLIPGLDSDSNIYHIKPFTDMAADLRVCGPGDMAGGTIVDDFDNDGNLDIVTSDWGLDRSMHYYRNNGDGSFSDFSVQSGLSSIKGGSNIIQADYNNDGFTDILVLRGAWLQQFGHQPSTLLKNNGDGTFTDVTLESGLLCFNNTQTATWADFNNDGWLDLFIGNESISKDQPISSLLFINNQDGTFTNATNNSGAGLFQFMKGVVSGDYDNDGFPDIFISSLDGTKTLLRNKGLKSKFPQFEDVTHNAGLDKLPTFTFPTWFWDYDNDGWPDIFVCGYLFKGSLGETAAAEALHKPLGNVNTMYLYHNNHDGTFTDVTKSTGLDHPVFAMGANFGDIDNDGWLDMYLGTGNPDFKSLVPNRLFKNINGKFFADITQSARVGNLQKGHGVSFADINNDGNQDIFIETGGAVPGDSYFNSLYINPGQNDNNWISILLKGKNSNRSAIGARIVLNFSDAGIKRTVYRDISSGGSFGASPFRSEIGIGKAKVVDELIVKWPTSGKVQVFRNIKPDQFLCVEEGLDSLQKLPVRPIKLKSQEFSIRTVGCSPLITNTR